MGADFYFDFEFFNVLMKHSRMLFAILNRKSSIVNCYALG
jgi:hypothetical protein